jgi:hypothetical protein
MPEPIIPAKCSDENSRPSIAKDKRSPLLVEKESKNGVTPQNSKTPQISQDFLRNLPK